MKYKDGFVDAVGQPSHPAGGAWIEIQVGIPYTMQRRVAPRRGCVD